MSAPQLNMPKGWEKTIDSRPVVGFIYELLRDHLPADTVEKIVRGCPEDTKVAMTNPHVAAYAQDIADRLGVPLPPEDGGRDERALEIVKANAGRILSLLELAKKGREIRDSGESYHEAEAHEYTLEVSEHAGPVEDKLYEVLKGLQEP